MQLYYYLLYLIQVTAHVGAGGVEIVKETKNTLVEMHGYLKIMVNHGYDMAVMI